MSSTRSLYYETKSIGHSNKYNENDNFHSRTMSSGFGLNRNNISANTSYSSSKRQDYYGLIHRPNKVDINTNNLLKNSSLNLNSNSNNNKNLTLNNTFSTSGFKSNFNSNNRDKELYNTNNLSFNVNKYNGLTNKNPSIKARSITGITINNYKNPSGRLSSSSRNNTLLGNLLPEAKTSKKTLVLDMDETLIHSSFTPIRCDFSFKVDLDYKTETIYVNKRPYLEEFINTLSKFYELIIFTASTSDVNNSKI